MSSVQLHASQNSIGMFVIPLDAKHFAEMNSRRFPPPIALLFHSKNDSVNQHEGMKQA